VPHPYKFLEVLCLLPILLWPLIFFISIFVFDDPTADERMQWLIFIIMNITPLIFIAALVMSNRTIKSDEEFAYRILLAPLIIIPFIYIFVFSFAL
jgi:hypothetical protein